MQACSLSQHVLQGRPAVGEVPLLSCVVQGGGDTCRGGWGKIEEELLNERSASACASSQRFFAKLWPAAVSQPTITVLFADGLSADEAGAPSSMSADGDELRPEASAMFFSAFPDVPMMFTLMCIMPVVPLEPRWLPAW